MTDDVTLTEHVQGKRREFARRVDRIKSDLLGDAQIKEMMEPTSYRELIRQLGLCQSALVLKVNPWVRRV